MILSRINFSNICQFTKLSLLGFVKLIQIWILMAIFYSKVILVGRDVISTRFVTRRQCFVASLALGYNDLLLTTHIALLFKNLYVQVYKTSQPCLSNKFKRSGRKTCIALLRRQICYLFTYEISRHWFQVVPLHENLND